MSATPRSSSDKDRLLTRPEEPLPTAQDPQQHENPKDPKPGPQSEQGTDPRAGELDHTV